MPPPIKKTTPEDRFFKMVIHGDSEAGKTYTSATSNQSDLGPSLLVALEANLECLDDMENPPDHILAKNEGGRWDIKIVEEVFWALASKSKDYADYKTIIFDTYSEGAASQIQAEARKRTGKEVWETAESLSQYEYVQTNRKMRDLVTKLRDLERNVIVTCHSVRDEIKVADVVKGYKYVFAVSQGSREPLERLFPCVAYMELKTPVATSENPEPDSVRVFHTKPSPRYFSKAKGNYAKIGNLGNPTFTEILEKMKS